MVKDDRSFIYSAGVEDEQGDYGMMAGPSPNLEEVMEQCHKERREVTIFRAEISPWKRYRVKKRGVWEKAKPHKATVKGGIV